jgi:hypothetical protein
MNADKKKSYFIEKLSGTHLRNLRIKTGKKFAEETDERR